MNRVEVLSTADRTGVAQIAVPAASTADLSADGATLWVGTTTEQTVAIDTATLKVRSRYDIQPLSPIPNTVFDRPEELLPMSSGKIMMRPAPVRGRAIASRDLGSRRQQSEQPHSRQACPVPEGLGAMAHTGDRTKLIVATNDASGEVAIFDARGAVVAGPHGFGAGTIPLVAANPDASRFAVEFSTKPANESSPSPPPASPSFNSPVSRSPSAQSPLPLVPPQAPQP